MIQHVAFLLDDNYSQCIEIVMAAILINSGSIVFLFLIWNTKGKLNIKALQYLFWSIKERNMKYSQRKKEKKRKKKDYWRRLWIDAICILVYYSVKDIWWCKNNRTHRENLIRFPTRHIHQSQSRSRY